MDPKKPTQPRKTLCAEILRGVGGLLLDRHGKRFANELGKRDYVTGRMLESMGHDAIAPNTFTILLHGKAAAVADKHVPFYTEKGLLKKFATLVEAARHLGLEESVLLETFKEYDAEAAQGQDRFGKKFFHNGPLHPGHGGGGGPCFLPASGPRWIGAGWGRAVRSGRRVSPSASSGAGAWQGGPGQQFGVLQRVVSTPPTFSPLVHFGASTRP